MSIALESRFSQASGRGRLLVHFLTWLAPAIVAAAFLWLISDIVLKGIGGVDWNFITEMPRNAGRAGGIAPIIVSTFLVIVVCVAVAVPLSLLTALFLSEFSRASRPISRVIRLSLNCLAAVPSIVFGIFGNALFCVALGMGFSILSGGLTLACMVLPILIRTMENAIRAVPEDYRLGAAALGLSKPQIIIRIVLPVSIPGLLVGLLLGVGRALAETAALVFTSGYVDRMPTSLLDSGRTLSIHILDLSMNVAGGDKNAYASVLVLGLFILAINSGIALLLFRFKQRSGLILQNSK